MPRRVVELWEVLARPIDLLRARLRSPLAFRVLRRRTGAWLVALVVATAVGALASDAQADRRAWGRRVQVVVALRHLEAGDRLGAADAELRDWPEAVVPEGALRSLPIGRRLSAAVVAGEALVGDRLARDGAGSTGARLDGDAAAVTVPLGGAPPPLAVGDRVDVLAPAHRAADPWSEPEQEPTDAVLVVARGAEVLALEEGHATLRVGRDEVDATAAAVLAGTLTLVLTG